MYTTKNNNKLDLSSAKEIAAGGEGKIYEHPRDKSKVVKIYHHARPTEFAKHLQLISSLGPLFIKPHDIYFKGAGLVAGFDMDYVNFNDYWLFNNLFNKGFCNTNGIDRAFKIKVLEKMKPAIEDLHSKDIIVGDLNQYNIFFSRIGDVLFVDTDSYGSSSNKHSGVLLDDIRDWTTLNINKETDVWAYDILSFWAATFCHPFKWVVPGNTESLEQRIKSHKSILSKIPGIKIPPLYDPLTGDVVKQFTEVFGGRRYMISFDKTHVPVSPVIKQQVASTTLIIREILTDVIDVVASKTMIGAKKDKWILIEAKIAQITRQVKEIECDRLYPAQDTYAYVKGETLYGEKGSQRSFIKPEFYYADGSLSVIDYANDTAYNFNLNNQLSGIDSTATSLFAKSITIRDAAIQNFGGRKYLNVPIKNTYSLIAVPGGTKNAFYTNGYAAIEHKQKSKIEYSIFNVAKQTKLELDFLPHFAVKDNLVFVPENGRIDVYSDFSLVTTLDASICTRDSKLYSTDAGIILFDHKTIYLLNTKK